MLPTLTYRGKVYRKFEEAAKQAASDLGTAEDAVDRRFAVSALNRVGPKAVPHLDALVAALKDEDRGVRYWAIVTLAGLGTEAVVPPGDVAALFKEDDPGIRYWAAELLGILGPKALAHVEILTTALKQDKDPDVRVVAAKALHTVDPSAVPNAVKVASANLQYKFGEEFFRASAAQALGVLGPAALPEVPALEKALGDKFASVRKAAVLALKALGRDAVRGVVAALGKVNDSDADALVREAAGEALAELGLPAALEDKDANVRHWAVLVCVDMGLRSIEHAPALASLLGKDPDRRVRVGAAIALGGAGKAAIDHSEALTLALTEVDPEVRTEAAKALATVNPDIGTSASATIAPGLKEKDPAYRLAAANGLREMGSAAMHHSFALEKLMSDGRADVRLAAVRALLGVGRGAVKAAQAEIADLAKSDPDGLVRRAAATALHKCELNRKWNIEPPARPLV